MIVKYSFNYEFINYVTCMHFIKQSVPSKIEAKWSIFWGLDTRFINSTDQTEPDQSENTVMQLRLLSELQYLNSPADVSASWQSGWAWRSVEEAPASSQRGPRSPHRSVCPPPSQSVSLSGVRSSPAGLPPSVCPSAVWKTARGRYSEYRRGHLRWWSICRCRLSLWCHRCCSHLSPRFLPRCSCTPCWPGLWTANR